MVAVTGFLNRAEAGTVLAAALMAYANCKSTLVLALPRGGVPVAYPIAKALQAPLDLLIARKLGVPHHPELAMGAIAGEGALVLNDEVIQDQGVTHAALASVIALEQKELARREKIYRPNRPPLVVQDRDVILVDDGMATGATMRVAIALLRKLHARKIILAVPVAAKETLQAFIPLADDVLCPLQPVHFNAVGEWYRDFSQTTDDEVLKLLNYLNK